MGEIKRTMSSETGIGHLARDCVERKDVRILVY